MLHCRNVRPDILGWRTGRPPLWRHVSEGGCHRAWYQSTRLAVDYPSMESPALLLPDNDPMDLSPLRLTDMARVGRQYGVVALVPILPN